MVQATARAECVRGGWLSVRRVVAVSAVVVTGLMVGSGLSLGLAGCHHTPPDLPAGLQEHELPDDATRLWKYIEREPSNMSAWRKLWWAVGEDQGARDDVAKACVRENPKLGAAHALLGASFYSYGRFVDAEVSWRKALELDPANDAALGLAELLQRFRREEDARVVLEASLAAVMPLAGVSDASKLERAWSLLALGDIGGAGASAAQWAKKIGGDHILAWQIQAIHAAMHSRFSEIPAQPQWTFQPIATREQMDRVRASGAVAVHDTFSYLVAFAGAAASVEDISRLEVLFRNGLNAYDTSEARAVCIAGLLACAWMREGLKPEASVPKEHHELANRLVGLGMMPGWVWNSVRGVRGAGELFEPNEHFTERAPSQAVMEMKLALLDPMSNDITRRSASIQFTRGTVASRIVGLANRFDADPKLLLHAAQIEYHRKQWANTKQLCERLLAAVPITDDERASTSSGTAGERVDPTWSELARGAARHMLLEARYFSGERANVMREVMAEEAQSPNRPGKHWIVALDEYWREAERRGLAKFPSASAAGA